MPRPIYGVNKQRTTCFKNLFPLVFVPVPAHETARDHPRTREGGCSVVKVIAKHAHELQYNAVDSAALRVALDDESRLATLPLRDGFEIALERAWDMSHSKARQSFGRLQQKRAGRWVTNRATRAGIANSDANER